MILQVLIFTLGALAAGLLALAALPAVWRRALRLSEERLSRLVPLSPEEVAAERDHLRAAHAVALRRTEQKLERTETVASTLKVEAARRESRILQLDDEVARARAAIAALEGDRAALRREVDHLWAESGAEAIALHDLSGLAERRLAEIAALQAERDDRTDEANRCRGSLAALETRLVGAETLNEDLGRDLVEARRQVETARSEAEAARREAREAQDGAEAARREARAAQDEAEAARRGMQAARTEGEAASHGQEVESLRTELAFMVEQAASAERRATESAKEAAKAQEALRARDAGRAAEALPAAAPPSETGDEAARLRSAIAALADDVLRVGRRLTPDAAAPAAPQGAAARRDPLDAE